MCYALAYDNDEVQEGKEPYFRPIFRETIKATGLYEPAKENRY